MRWSCGSSSTYPADAELNSIIISLLSFFPRGFFVVLKTVTEIRKSLEIKINYTIIREKNKD
jgi:hypothetical protein